MFMSFKLLCVQVCESFLSHFSCVPLKVGSCPVLHQVLWLGCSIPIAWSSAVFFVWVVVSPHVIRDDSHEYVTPPEQLTSFNEHILHY